MKNFIANNSTILLVDDESDILDFTKEEISSSFAKVLTAKDGLEACEIIKREKVDLIVTDYIMPNMNGLELINHVKINFPLIPMIMLTSNGNNPEVLFALESGAFDILDKPFRTPVLINRIRNGLLVPELTKVLWSLMSKDLSLPRLEEFLSKPLVEQHRIIYAYSSVIKMKSIVRSDGAGESNG